MVVYMQFGDDHAVLRTLQGKLYVPGNNSHGQLAMSDAAGAPGPIQLSDLVVLQADCGAYHTILLRQDNCVYTFGDNRFGQTGNGNSPHKVVSSFKVSIYSLDDANQTNILEKISQVTAGSNHWRSRSMASYGRGDGIEMHSLVCMMMSSLFTLPKASCSSHQSNASQSSSRLLLLWTTRQLSLLMAMFTCGERSLLAARLVVFHYMSRWITVALISL